MSRGPSGPPPDSLNPDDDWRWDDIFSRMWAPRGKNGKGKAGKGLEPTDGQKGIPFETDYLRHFEFCGRANGKGTRKGIDESDDELGTGGMGFTDGTESHDLEPEGFEVFKTDGKGKSAKGFTTGIEPHDFSGMHGDKDKQA